MYLSGRTLNAQAFGHGESNIAVKGNTAAKDTGARTTRSELHWNSCHNIIVPCNSHLLL